VVPGLTCPVGQSIVGRQAVCVLCLHCIKSWTKTVLHASSNGTGFFLILHAQYGQHRTAISAGPHPPPQLTS
jgi:hypothetical protein